MKDLTKGNDIKVIIQFAIPIFLANVLQLTYSFVDTRMVGEFLGDHALAAVGLTNPLNTLIVGLLTGLTELRNALTVHLRHSMKDFTRRFSGCLHLDL